MKYLFSGSQLTEEKASFCVCLLLRRRIEIHYNVNKRASFDCGFAGFESHTEIDDVFRAKGGGGYHARHLSDGKFQVGFRRCGAYDVTCAHKEAFLHREIDQVH